ncbi:MAG TPA: NAD-dependent epimerase/dehydratase family protein [Anaerolineae bacterium]|nr:NAD-dependent epimerase/dehydratase family protein [Anaerolineae bacterium]
MIFVTGATGFLGHNLIPFLIARGHAIRALVRPTGQWQFLADLGVELAWGDTRDRAEVIAAVKGCRFVVHGAGHFRFWGRYADFHSTNVQGTHNVLEAAYRAGVERLVHISTIAVVGRPRSGTVIDETYPCEPCDNYMRSKLDGEALVQRYHHTHNLPALILRPGAYYGPWGHYAFNRLFFEDPFMKGLPIQVHGGRHVTFPIFLPDLACVIHAALSHGRPGEIYNVSGPSLTHREINTIISRITSFTPRWINLPAPAILLLARVWTALAQITRREPYYPINMAPYVFNDWLVDSNKAARELHFNPTSFEAGARATLEWYRNIGMLKD